MAEQKEIKKHEPLTIKIQTAEGWIREIKRKTGKRPCLVFEEKRKIMPT